MRQQFENYMFRKSNSRLLVTTLLLFLLWGCNHQITTTTSQPTDIWKTARGSEERFELLLPPGEYRAELMRFVAPARFIELSSRLVAALRANPELVMELEAQGEPGEPVPYDGRIGLTEEEHAEYLRLSDQLRLAKYDEATVTVERDQSGEFVLGLPVDSEMNGIITLDSKQLTVKTPYGDLASPSDVVADPRQLATGPFNGYSWRNEATPSSSEPRIKLYIGQLAESKKGFIAYEVRDMSTGKRVIDLAMHIERLSESTSGK
jgi:hypothetical protein